MIEIDGETRLFAIVGDPVSGVRSPLVYNPRFAQLGKNAVMVPVHVPIAHFAAVMAGLMHTGNLDGFIVTYPFKKSAMALADTLSPMAQQVGALNAMRRDADGRWTGDMLDGVGLVRAVGSLGQTVRGRRIKLIGAGGAGSAIAMALAAEGAATLSIHDRNPGRAAAYVQLIERYYPSCHAEAGDAILGDHDLLINATPVGMKPGDGLPLKLDDLSAATTVIDIVPKPAVTALLALAGERGCPRVGGAAMVAGQADAMLAFFSVSAAEA